jgi:hypothetical protein
MIPILQALAPRNKLTISAMATPSITPMTRWSARESESEIAGWTIETTAIGAK